MMNAGPGLDLRTMPAVHHEGFGCYIEQFTHKLTFDKYLR